MLLKQLDILIALSGSKTFIETASKLKCSQASISKSVQTLESNLGFRIIEHSYEGISFTQKGHFLLEKANEIHNEARNIKNIKYSFFNDIGGSFVMGCYTHTYILLLVDMLIHLQREYPNLRISLEDRGNNQIMTNVSNRTYPLGLIQLNNIDGIYYQSELLRRGLRSTPIFSEPLRVIVGSNHTLANRGPLPLNKILSHSTLVSRYALSEYFEQFLRQHGHQDSVVIMSDIHTQRKVIGNSDRHIAIIPHSGVKSSNHIYQENLNIIPISDYTLTGGPYWVEHIQGYSKQEEQIISLIKQCWDDILRKEGLL